MLLQKYLCIGMHFLNLVVYNGEGLFGGYLKNLFNTGHEINFLRQEPFGS